MSKKRKNIFNEINYDTEATPREVTPDGIPVFCSFDELVEIEKAVPNPKNPNQHGTEQVRLLGSIIQANGWRAPITISKRSGFIVKGHGRRLAALHIGSEHVPVDDKADAIQEPDNIPMSKVGDIWYLGNHKLICGDSTDPETINRLMDGEKAQMVNTDPPYGVSYETQSGKFDMIKNDDLTGDDLMGTLLIPVFKAYVEHTDPEAGFYIWHASSTRRDFEDAMAAAGILEKQYIIWVKNGIALGRADYQWAHEPCFYAEKAGETAKFYGDRAQRTTWKVVLRDEDHMATVLTGGVVLTDGAGGKVYLNDKPPKGRKIRYIRLSSGKSVTLFPESKATTAWEVDRETGTEHPTQKPVELAIRAIDNSSAPGDLVIDFFGGSGSTLIGAEMAGRRCNTVELDPRYCDVIINRYVRFTGNVGVTCRRGDQELQYVALKEENDQLNAANLPEEPEEDPEE